MEAVLERPHSLLDLLWEHERDAAPLASPEDKAGLKARLLEHVDTIADRDIQALYRRELLERFSAFAFPPRAQREWRPGGRPAPPQRANRETVARAQRPENRDGLSAAVLTGLLRFPRELARHAEQLAQANLPDPRFEVLADALDGGEVVESEQLTTILAQRGLVPPLAQEYASLRFGFLADDMPEAQARAELAQAVGLLIERPALEAALAEATRRFERDLSEGAYAEQQRLLKRKLEFDARLRQMASARAAAPIGAASQKMAE
jgi:DNA primase